MCGIVAGLGKINYPDFFLQSLKILEYRGYDSCGIGYNVDGNTLVSFKTVGTVEQLTNKIDRTIKPVSAIAHTRWATHGKISFQNAFRVRLIGMFFLLFIRYCICIKIKTQI